MEFRSTIHICVFLFVMQGCLASSARLKAVFAQTFVIEKTDAEKIEDYLGRLGLEDQLIAHLEQQFGGTPDERARKRASQKLAALYQKRLMQSGSGVQEPAMWRERAESLLERAPDLNAPTLRVAMSHASYQEVNHEFQEWWLAGAAPEKRADVVSSWRVLIRDLLQLHNATERTRNRLVTIDGTAPDEDDPVAQQIIENENVYLQTNYLLGWACYFRSIADTGHRGQWTTMAEKHFRMFLQVNPDKPLAELTPDWLDFNSPWTSRGVVGLALCSQAQDNHDLAAHLFNLSLASGDPKFAATLDAWKLSSAAYIDDYPRALLVLEEYRPVRGEAADFAFRILCVRIGNAIRNRETAAAEQLFDNGLVALTRLGNTRLISELLEKVDSQMLSGTGDFELNWLLGILESSDAGNTSDSERLNGARRNLERALGQANEESDRNDVARCQYSLGRICYRQREFEKSAALFQSASAQLRAVDSGLAAESLWFEIQSLTQLARRAPQHAPQAFLAMDRMLHWFPGTRYSQRVEFEKLRLESASLPPGDAMKRLQSVPPDSENYFRAVYEMTGIQYEMWLAAFRQSAPTSDALLRRLEELEREYRDGPADGKGSTSEEHRLKALLLVVDAKLKSARRAGDVRLDQAGTLLKIAAQIAEPMGDQPLQAGPYTEFRYYRFLHASRATTDTETDSLANDAKWLADNGRDTAFENAALVFLVRRNDLLINERAMVSSLIDGLVVESVEVQTGIDLYNRLAEISGIAAEDLKRSPNSRFITSRLSELYFFNGQWSLADDFNRKLIEQWPGQQKYVLQAARLRMKLNDFETARELWRRIATAVEPGTDVWFEAKFQLIVCLQEINTEFAPGVYRQTRGLSPEMPDAWRDRFDKLGVALEQ